MTHLRIVTALLIAWIVLTLPSNPASLSSIAELQFPLELLLLAFGAVLLPGLAFSAFCIFAMLLIAIVLFLKLADIGTGAAFQRPFNPYLDIKIIVDGWNLLSGSVGRGEAAVWIGLAVLLLVAICLLFFWSLGDFRRIRGRARTVSAASAAILFAAGCIALLSSSSAASALSLNLAPYLNNRITMIRKSVQDLSAFEEELASDPISDIPPATLFSSLRNTDVIVIFVESYGRTALEDGRYAPTVAARLREFEAELRGVGLEARSGWLTSPTVGGLSWLAHGALLSGLWTDSQARYDRMIASDRKTLNALFRSAGWRTTAIMPAITMAWPESGYFGYDSIRDSASLGYEGRPFNWVTMPDQYTLSAFERLERETSEAPLMAEIALISSHAPWTPIPTLVEWDRIGDGHIFDDQATSGDPPSVLWSDPERIRRQYLASIDYVLQTLGSYIRHYGDDKLFIIVGDHQPASVITGDDASRDVPVHIMGTSDSLEQIGGWGWSAGMHPAPQLPAVRMDLFRERFVRAYSGTDS
ncbi:hypothetical protein ABID21_003073 [Pseudorhizobium tarimense]|uniref:Phosphoglycerol transferase MdoB n=1 Tax=Pseudorhizobium tarimense TaxID=1079109 RepID=A0ABV2H8V7_9HYPH|nr:sulfatase [Pseudorhizobium tarimense]MCJ8520075.1 sulfatase [Pseudorhizobium tarimense]